MDSDDEVPEAVPIGQEPDTNVKSEQPESSGQHRTVPVLLITGFLGAGKTTLLNYILTEQHGYRCAVILNEFGESAGIEKAILNDSKENEAFELQDWIQLSNGCACCSVKNDFVKALESLMSRKGMYDYILIETTGLASPGPIASALWTDPELEADVCLDAILTVCDATNIRRQLADEREDGAINEAQEQIAYADIILCNKVDCIAGVGALAEVEEAIRGLNADAVIHKTERCRIDLGLILNRGLFNPESSGRPAGSSGSAVIEAHAHGETPAGHRSAHSATAPGPATEHMHDSRIRTVRLVVPGQFDLERLRGWLDSVLWDQELRTEDILRLKGVVNVLESQNQKIIQAVHEVYDIQDAGSDRPIDSTANEIVLIGRHLDEEKLMVSLNECMVSGS